MCAALLVDSDILDWPAWATSGSTLELYVVYVKAVLFEKHALSWRSKVACHSCTPPYRVLADVPGVVRGFIKSLEPPAATELVVRHWCRLRCGLVLLMHLGGRASGAKYQDCIFCGQCMSKPTIHYLSLCTHWSSHRAEFSSVTGLVLADYHQQFCVRCLSTELDSASFIIAADWVADIDKGAGLFWASR